MKLFLMTAVLALIAPVASAQSLLVEDAADPKAQMVLAGPTADPADPTARYVLTYDTGGTPVWVKEGSLLSPPNLDNDPANEIPTVSVNGDTLTWVDGTTFTSNVSAPIAGAGIALTGTAPNQTISAVVDPDPNNAVQIGPNGIFVEDYCIDDGPFSVYGTPVLLTDADISVNGSFVGNTGTTGVEVAALTNTSACNISVKVCVQIAEAQTVIREGGNAGTAWQAQVNGSAWVGNPVGTIPWAVQFTGIAGGLDQNEWASNRQCYAPFTVTPGSTVDARMRVFRNIAGPTNAVNYAYVQADIERIF